MVGDDLNARQRQFVEEYLIDLNQAQAAIRAGYSPKAASQHGSRLMANAKVRAAVEAAQKARAERTQITQDWVLSTLYDTAERCKQAVPVLDREGNQETALVGEGNDEREIGLYQFQPMAVLRAAELAGKHLKMFTDKHEHTGAGGGPLQVIISGDDAKL